jgi:hypothetical protein
VWFEATSPPPPPPFFLSFFEESEARERCDYDEWDK